MEEAVAYAPGQVLAGKYRIERTLGEGGMGVVVAATHLQLEQLVAIKFLLPAALASPEAQNRFVREARAAVKLKGEHVVRVLDVGTLETGAPYIVMEYLQGTDLGQIVASSGPLPPASAVDYLLQACEALAEAHGQGIVHRDLKPSNLFLTQRPDGSPLVKVFDFGISKMGYGQDPSLNITRTREIMGSPSYMSPEQLMSSRDVDPRSDIYSLGVVLYQLLTGRLPFEAETFPQLLLCVMQEPPPPLASVRPDLPLELCAAVDRCLAKDRAQRFQDVGELASVLAPFANPFGQVAAARTTALARATGLASIAGAPPVTQSLGGGAQLTGTGTAHPTSPGVFGTGSPPPPGVAGAASSVDLAPPARGGRGRTLVIGLVVLILGGAAIGAGVALSGKGGGGGSPGAGAAGGSAGAGATGASDAGPARAAPPIVLDAALAAPIAAVDAGVAAPPSAPPDAAPARADAGPRRPRRNPGGGSDDPFDSRH